MCQATTKSWGTSLWVLSRSVHYSLLWRDSAWWGKSTADAMEQSSIQTPSFSATTPQDAQCWASLARMWVAWSLSLSLCEGTKAQAVSCLACVNGCPSVISALAGGLPLLHGRDICRPEESVQIPHQLLGGGHPQHENA